jgi:glucuronate isomerase
MELHREVATLLLICSHGHVEPRLFANENATFGTSADLLLIPDHYICRVLYSQSIPLESLGVSCVDGGPVETDHRRIWQSFTEKKLPTYVLWIYWGP